MIRRFFVNLCLTALVALATAWVAARYFCQALAWVWAGAPLPDVFGGEG